MLAIRADPRRRKCARSHAGILLFHHDRDPKCNDPEDESDDEPNPRIPPLHRGNNRCSYRAHAPDDYEFSRWHCPLYFKEVDWYLPGAKLDPLPTVKTG